MELEVYLALNRGGVDAPEARLASAEIRKGVLELIASSQLDLATKNEIACMEAATKEQITRLALATKNDIERLEQSTKSEITRLEIARRTEIARLDVEIVGLTQRLAEVQRWTIGTLFGGFGLIAALMTVYKFVD
jgi:hypothetical protein